MIIIIIVITIIIFIITIIILMITMTMMIRITVKTVVGESLISKKRAEIFVVQCYTACWTYERRCLVVREEVQWGSGSCSTSMFLTSACSCSTFHLSDCKDEGYVRFFEAKKRKNIFSQGKQFKITNICPCHQVKHRQWRCGRTAWKRKGWKN